MITRVQEAIIEAVARKREPVRSPESFEEGWNAALDLILDGEGDLKSIAESMRT